MDCGRGRPRAVRSRRPYTRISHEKLKIAPKLNASSLKHALKRQYTLLAQKLTTSPSQHALKRQSPKLEPPAHKFELFSSDVALHPAVIYQPRVVQRELDRRRALSLVWRRRRENGRLAKKGKMKSSLSRRGAIIRRPSVR